MTAACAVMGNWRNRSIPSIGTPSQKLNSAYLIEHVSGLEGCSWVAPGRRELEPGRESVPNPSFLPLVFDLAEESRPHNGVGPLDIGEFRGQKRPLNLKSSIFVDSSHSQLLVLADNEVFVAVPCDLERIVWILRVDPAAVEFRSPGCVPCEGNGTEQAYEDDAKDQSFH